MSPVKRSRQHIAAYEALRSLFGKSVRIIEEHPVKLPGRTLFIDLYLPHLKLAIEIDGRQHSEFSVFMHGSRQAFQQQRANDYAKEQWCRQEGIKLRRLGYKDEVSRASILALIQGEDDE